MPFLLIDEYGAHTNGTDNYSTVFDTLTEVCIAVSDRASEYDDDDYNLDCFNDGLEVYQIVTKVPISVKRGKPVMKIGNDSSEPREIPEPLPGESFGEYALRLAQGM